MYLCYGILCKFANDVLVLCLWVNMSNLMIKMWNFEKEWHKTEIRAIQTGFVCNTFLVNDEYVKFEK